MSTPASIVRAFAAAVATAAFAGLAASQAPQASWYLHVRTLC